MAKLKLAIIVGSNRHESINRKLAQALAKLGEGAFDVSFVQIDDLPMFNQDLESNRPESTLRLKREIEAADAILIVTPEHNRSIPAVLKNAIDWASRPPDQPFNNKPCALISASGGPTGGIRAQFHLRHILVALNAFPVNNPHVIVAGAPDKFDANGKFTDPVGKELMRQLLDNLVKWAKVLKA